MELLTEIHYATIWYVYRSVVTTILFFGNAVHMPATGESVDLDCKIPRKQARAI
jgi:hypothetical protein